MTTLHLIEKLKNVRKSDTYGLLESHCWILTEEEMKADYIALHRTKSAKAHLAGKIIKMFPSNEEEGRTVVVFKLESRDKVRWSGNRSDMMAYKSLAT